MHRLTLTAATIAAALALAVPAQAETGDDAAPSGSNDFACKPSDQHPRPVVLVHGLSASQSTNWGYHSPKIKAAGYCVFSLSYGLDTRTRSWPYRPGGTIPMQESSKELKSFVNEVLAVTGAKKVDLVGHSEGTVMPRWYLERRGGRKHVKRFVALTPLWRGTNLAEAAMLRDLGEPWGISKPLVDLVAGICGSCPQFVRGSDYLNELNSDGERIKGINHTNIATATDELVHPYTSGLMVDGGKNIVLQDACPLDLSGHSALAFDPVITQLILNALDPKDSRPIRC